MNGYEGELKDGERTTGDQQGRPDLPSLSPAAHAPDHIGRDDEGENRQLVARHNAQLFRGQVRDAGEGDERRARSTVGDRGRVSDEAVHGRLERIEAESDQTR